MKKRALVDEPVVSFPKTTYLYRNKQEILEYGRAERGGSTPRSATVSCSPWTRCIANVSLPRQSMISESHL